VVYEQVTTGARQAAGQEADRAPGGYGARTHSLPRLVVVILLSPSFALFNHDQVKTLPPYPDAEIVIPVGHGWLEGDAPFNSEDSNHFGPVRVVFPDMVHHYLG
jgi:hypothetical protein